MSLRLGRTIAQRVLTLEAKKTKRIIVRLGMPRKEERRGRPRKEELPVWMCPFQIAGIGRPRVARALGLDAFQALLLALEAIRLQLARASIGATWEGGEKGDPGFPEMITMGLGSAFATRISRIIAREEKAFVRERLKKRREARRSKAQQKR